MSPRPFDTKFKRSNSGLFYLVVIGLSAAVSANLFVEEGFLLAPVVAVIGALLLGMCLISGLPRSR